MAVATYIDTPRLALRKPEAGDLPAYTAYCASPRSRYVRGPFTAQQAFDKFATIIGHWTLCGFGRYVIHHQGQPIGHVGPLAAVDTPEAPEMTWTLWQGTAEGQGFATEAAQAVAQHLLSDCGWDALLIRILPDNTGSIRIAERLGATRTDLPAPHWYPGACTYRLSQADFA